MSSDTGESAEDEIGGGCSASAFLGIERQAGDALAFHFSAYGPLDEAEDQQREEVEQQQGGDPFRLLEEHRSDIEHALHLFVPLFEVGLVLVLVERLGGSERLAVGDEGKESVVVGRLPEGLPIVFDLEDEPRDFFGSSGKRARTTMRWTTFLSASTQAPTEEAAPTAFASASAHKGRGRCDGDGGRGFRGSFSEDIVIARFANITD